MELRHIKAGGKERPFLFSYRAIKELGEKHDADIPEMELMSYLGFKYGAIRQGYEVDFSMEDVESWFEDDLETFLEVVEVIKEMQPKLEKMMASLKGQQVRGQRMQKSKKA